MMPSLEARTEFIARLKDEEVTAVFHYLPLNRSAYALQMADPRENRYGVTSSEWRRTDCPVTEDVRLPFLYDHDGGGAGESDGGSQKAKKCK